jgi:hypothetical protein
MKFNFENVEFLPKMIRSELRHLKSTSKSTSTSLVKIPNHELTNKSTPKFWKAHNYHLNIWLKYMT